MVASPGDCLAEESLMLNGLTDSGWWCDLGRWKHDMGT